MQPDISEASLVVEKLTTMLVDNGYDGHVKSYPNQGRFILTVENLDAEDLADMFTDEGFPCVLHRKTEGSVYHVGEHVYFDINDTTRMINILYGKPN